MVFQYPEYQLFAETVFDDVAFGLKNFAEKEMSQVEIESAVRQAIEMVGLSYEQVKDKSPFELSGGQKRRVAIAGVLVTKPEILVLDEPAAGLDPKGKKEIAELLHAVHKTWCKTVIIVSHDMDEIAENCSRAAIFHDGKIYCIGTPAEIFSAANGVSKAEQAGLDQPFIAKLERELSRHGIQVNSNLTMTDFFASFGEKGTAGNGFDEGGAC
jgi:energy-coupling factor transport system ATP-binding protein